MTAAKRLFNSKTASLPTAVIPKLNRPVTRVGFGAYRVSDESHAQALRAAIQAGVNIIDTASNFENGASENIIGDTVHDMVSSGKVKRQDLTIVTKSGYLAPADIESLETKDYVQINEKSYHGISPRVLERQIATSLERLKMKKLDIFMLNAPERMLMGKSRRYTASQLYAEIGESFKYLDSLVANGTIGGYGVCSNTMALGSAADHISLPDIQSACSNPSNFVAIEAPFNVFEREALISGAAPGLSLPTIAQFAEENGIYLMTNRPLNAIANGQIRVLVNHALGGDKEGSTASEQQWIEQLSQSFQKVSQLEADMMSELPAEEENLAAKFVWGQVLSENLPRLAQNHFAARHYLTRQVLPAVEKDVQALKKYAAALGNDEKEAAFDHWIDEYRESINTLSQDMVNYVYIDTLRKNSELDRVLNALSPTLGKQSDEGVHSPLSVKMLRVLLANRQIGTVFTGMRYPAYVHDAVYAAEESVRNPIRAEELEDIWQCPIFY